MPKRKIDPADVDPADRLGELERQRQERMEQLIETQRMVAQHNREVAAREQQQFGTGDQG